MACSNRTHTSRMNKYIDLAFQHWLHNPNQSVQRWIHIPSLQQHDCPRTKQNKMHARICSKKYACKAKTTFWIHWLVQQTCQSNGIRHFAREMTSSIASGEPGKSSNWMHSTAGHITRTREQTQAIRTWRQTTIPACIFFLWASWACIPSSLRGTAMQEGSEHTATLMERHCTLQLLETKRQLQEHTALHVCDMSWFQEQPFWHETARAKYQEPTTSSVPT